MHDAERDLLLAIAAAPAEDFPRMVYADWLDDHDRAVEAEFIRVQMDIAKLHQGTRAAMNRHVDIWKRQQELLDHHLPELLGPLAALWGRVTPEFERGFLSRVELPWGLFRASAGELLARIPRPDVAVTKVDYARFADWDALPDGAASLVTELRLEPITADEPPDPTDPALFCWWRRLDRLRVLNCSQAFQSDADLTAVPWADLGNLADLDLSHCGLSDSSVIHFVNTGVPLRLERLILGGNALTDQSAYELADRLGRSRRLKYLNLRYTHLTSAGQSAITTAFGGRVDLF